MAAYFILSTLTDEGRETIMRMPAVPGSPGTARPLTLTALPIRGFIAEVK
jgi:uncharacterized protein with GYD domain